MKILKNYTYNMVYQILLMLIPLATVPYVSRTLGAEGVGIYSYTYSIVQYFVLFGNLGISMYGVRSIAYTRESDFQRSKIFFELVIIKLFMFILSMVSYILFIILYKEYILIFILQGIFIIASGIDVSWYFIGLEDFKKTISRKIGVKLVALVSVFIFINSPDDIALYVAINAVSILIGNLTLWTFLRKKVCSVSWKDLELRKHIKPVVLLFLPQLLTQIFANMNKLLLGNFSNFTQTGYFENADKVIRMLSAFVTAIGNVIFPRISNAFNKGETTNVNKHTILSFNIVNMIAFPLLFGMILISKNFSLLFFGDNFAQIEYTLSILAVGLIFMGWGSIIGQQYLIATNQTKKSIISLFIGVLSAFILSVILIPIHGAFGAAIAAVVGESVISATQIVMVKKYMQLPLFAECTKYIFAAVIMYATGWGIGTLIERPIYSMSLQIITCIIVYTSLMLVMNPSPVQEMKRELEKVN